MLTEDHGPKLLHAGPLAWQGWLFGLMVSTQLVETVNGGEVVYTNMEI